MFLCIVRACVCVCYQVSGSGECEERQAEVEVLLDDQVTQERSQDDPTHAQQVGDGPRVLVLKGDN